MLKWIILGVLLVGVMTGSLSSGSDVAKSRFGCPASSGENINENSGDNANENGTDGNENGSDNGNSNSAANENTNSASNANENTNSASNANENGSANVNDNSSANANENSSNSNANDNGSDTGTTINGRFAGTLTGTSTESLSGTPNPPRDRQLLPSVQFEGAFTPVVLHVLHYSDSTPGSGGAPATVDTSNLTNVLVGQTQTLNYSDPAPVTLGVTVTEASYLTRQFRVVLALTFNSTSGNLTRTGTGTQTIEGELDGDDNLVLSIETQYDVDLRVGQPPNDFTLVTGELIELTGTLPRQ